jgi:salicylate hydroxylase
LTKKLLIAGAGIGGLSAAIACARTAAPADLSITLFERSNELAEVGAGLQLGPNVTAVLNRWGLEQALHKVAMVPESLRVMSAITGAELGKLVLGAHARVRYGAPYLTIHRSDLQALLLSALKHCENVEINLGCAIADFDQDGKGVAVHTTDGRQVQGDALVGADGLWSRVRQQLLSDGPPRVTGHVAHRALVKQADLPERLRTRQITVWLGPHLHVVHYPVRGGDWLNVVAIHQGLPGRPDDKDATNWDRAANAVALQTAMAATCPALQDLMQSIEPWRLWALSIRPPVRNSRSMAQGRVALLGDAAHPMLPFLAQGAGMAIEDAQALANSLSDDATDVPGALLVYAARRWQRNARVQARSIRNGQIFHATGPLRVARDVSLALLGNKLLDMPWLYRHRE